MINLRNWMMRNLIIGTLVRLGSKKKVIIEPKKPDSQVCLIQSVYSDYNLSKYRLEISNKTVIQSLKFPVIKIDAKYVHLIHFKMRDLCF